MKIIYLWLHKNIYSGNNIPKIETKNWITMTGFWVRFSKTKKKQQIRKNRRSKIGLGGAGQNSAFLT